MTTREVTQESNEIGTEFLSRQQMILEAMGHLENMPFDEGRVVDDGHDESIRPATVRGRSIGIIGCGGVGSNLAYMLTRLNQRPGRIVLIDDDKVERKNLDRQLFRKEDVGRPKAEALGEFLTQISDDIEIEYYDHKINSVMDLSLVGDCNYLVAATDNIASKKIIDDAYNQGLTKSTIYVACEKDEFELKFKLNDEDRATWTVRGGYNSNQTSNSNLSSAFLISQYFENGLIDSYYRDNAITVKTEAIPSLLSNSMFIKHIDSVNISDESQKLFIETSSLGFSLGNNFEPYTDADITLEFPYESALHTFVMACYNAAIPFYYGGSEIKDKSLLVDYCYKGPSVFKKKQKEKPPQAISHSITSTNELTLTYPTGTPIGVDYTWRNQE